VLETPGTPLHGTRVAPALLVWAVGALAEGLGIRAVARVFEVDPNPVLAWLVEAADHLKAFSPSFLHDVRVTQGQLDELYALLRAVKEGDVSEAEALQRLSRSPHWVWVAIDPVSKLRLALDVGERTLAMAQHVVQQVVQVLAPGCVPRFLTDGFKGVPHGVARPLRPLGPAATPPGHRSLPEAALAATAWAARRAGDQDRTAPAPGTRDTPCGVRHARSGQRRVGSMRRAEQYRVCGTPQPHHPPARGGRWAAREPPLQGRGRGPPPAGLVPRVR
jgi:hypothetical protein